MVRKSTEIPENNSEFTHKGWNFVALCNAAGLPSNIENITDPNYALYGNGYMDRNQEPYNFICRAESLDRVGTVLEIQTNMNSNDPDMPKVVLYFHWDRNPEAVSKWTGTKGPGREFTLEDLYFSPSQAKESWEAEAEATKASADPATEDESNAESEDGENFLVLPEFVAHSPEEIVDVELLGDDPNDPLAEKAN